MVKNKELKTNVTNAHHVYLVRLSSTMNAPIIKTQKIVIVGKNPIKPQEIVNLVKMEYLKHKQVVYSKACGNRLLSFQVQTNRAVLMP